MIRYRDWKFDRTSLVVHHGNLHYQFNGNGGERTHIKLKHSGRFIATEHLVLSGGRATRESLFSRLYADDPEGGPVMGTKQIGVMLCQMQELVFPRLGVMLVSDQRAGVRWYELKPFNVIEIAQKIRDVVRPTA